MKLLPLSPAKTLHPAYRIQNVERGRLERFKTELARLLEHLGHSAQESEEHLKNIVSDFLKGAFYRDEHFVNTKDRQDLVIHNGRTAKDSVGVIIETKKPGNKSEMITADKPNTKALHELLRYYLNERNRLDNKEIRHLVITDIHVWYIFDAADFERHIYANTKLLKQYADWSEGRLGAGNTDWFYKEIAAPFFEKELPELRCCRFDLRDYVQAATNADPGDDDLLLDLYKILSPQYLLKKPFANDSNALNKQFYDELLYILGLEEVKEGGKKLINRAGKRRHDGSLLENTLSELEVNGVWRDATGLDQFGESAEEQRYSIALELCITWLNRILFLKLLEGQLIRWRGGERLLSVDKVKDYDELNELFFHVLAVPEAERRASVQQQFGSIPYLNSSLFEQTELERRTLRVSALKDRLEMPVLPNSVLRQGANPPASMQTLNYLFAFLDAYDFSSDAKARIQAENRAVINASVLGLIFEKINGYRDGSFFTPGFITMYMCRETLRRAVLQKFNERYNWDCQNVETDLHNELIRQKIPLQAANTLINSLRICDPAVGSGHFLVSALNELIAIKSDLGILCDPAGKLLPLNAVVGNDELILTDRETDQPIEYRPGNTVSQRVQEALFHEKQTLIENCLFGVDINPKSVMICRLRLWIELLKHAYFRAGSQYQRLETLPNIDINIKTGNSLVSRFALEEDLKDVFAKGKIKANDYRLAVAAYKNASDKAAKAGLLEQIGRVKSAIYESFYLNNPLNKKLKKLLGDRFLLENKAAVGDLFEKLKSKDISEDLNKINREIAGLETQIEDLKQGKTYRNSFEWRFEFPEVLDDEGEYIGFDAIIGNPPYGLFAKYSQDYFAHKYLQCKKFPDSYCQFIVLGQTLLSEKSQFAYIVPNTFCDLESCDDFRKWLLSSIKINIILESGWAFDEAVVDTIVFVAENTKPQIADDVKILIRENESRRLVKGFLENDLFKIDYRNNSKNVQILSNILNTFKLSDFFEVKAGVKIYEKGKGNPPQDESTLKERPFTSESLSEGWSLLYRGVNINRYSINKTNDYVKYGEWLAAPRNRDLFIGPKILMRRTDDRIKASIDFEDSICVNSCHVLKLKDKWVKEYRYEYFLGLINSKLIQWVFEIQNPQMVGKVFSEIKVVYVERLPIKPISKAEANDVEIEGRIVSLVTQILAAKQSSPSADTRALEAEVDGLVYGLYGLTEEEIGIVEGGA